MGFNGETVRFQTKKKEISSLNQRTLRNKRPLNATIDDGTCYQEELN